MRYLAPNASNKRRAFTFVEVLASMLFIAIVIPAAIKGIRLAAEAGTLAERKSTALQLGESLLQEMIVTEEWRSSTGGGTFEEPWENYEWRIETGTWTEPGLQMLTLYVTFPIRQQPFEISMTTLVPESTE